MTASIDAKLRALAGPMSGRNIIGETTEALHRFLLDGWNLGENPPRLEEDLEFVPKDREEVIYIYMYRLAHNTNLQNLKRLRQAPVFVKSDPESGGEVYYHRPPILIDLFYLLAVHSKFRSDAERLLGWLVLRLNEATHLIYRPRRFLLPDGREVDSLGRPYDPANFQGWTPPEGAEGAEEEDDGLQVEKVSLSLVEDLTVGDAINLYTLHEAPYRPYLTYRARVALDGPLYKSEGGTAIRLPRAMNPVPPPADPRTTPTGRIKPGRPFPGPAKAPGPKAYKLKKNFQEPETEE